jgi:predicted metalloprotease with PDZ domain
MHSFMRARSGSDGDWIVEGLAELYSVSLLRRSGTLSASRYERALEAIAKRAKRGGPLRVEVVNGDTRAKAVIVLLEIDDAIRQATGGARDLDDVVRELAAQDGAITTNGFRTIVAEVAGRDLDDLFERYAPKPRATGR